MVCVGAIIGAGFASGKELVSFFGDNGFWALLFVPIVAVLFFWCFYLFSKLGKSIKPKSISDMTKRIFGKAHMVVDFSFILCTFITLASMLAGCDSIGAIAFGDGYNFCYISIITALIVVALLSVGLKWIYKVNNYVLPVILVSMAVIIIGFFASGTKASVSPEYISVKPFASCLSCFLYVGMNIFTNIFIIAKSSLYLNKKQIVLASALTSAVLCIFVSVILTCIFCAGDKVFLSDMPMVSVAYSISGFLGSIYSIVLWLAIFTTICLAGYSIQMWLNNYIKNNFLCGVITITIGFVFSRFGFSTIVNIFYPLEGIFALVMIIYCTIYYLKNLKTNKINNQLKLQKLQNQKVSASLDFYLQDHQSMRTEQMENALDIKQNPLILDKNENINQLTHNKTLYQITDNKKDANITDSITVQNKNGKRIITKKTRKHIDKK